MQVIQPSPPLTPYFNHSIEGREKSNEEILKPSSVFTAQGFSGDDFLERIVEFQPYDIELFAQSPLGQIKFPALGVDTLIEIVEELKKTIFVKVRESSYEIEIPLIELLRKQEKLKQKFPNTKITSYEFVGGIVYWFLRKYIRDVFKDNQFEKLLPEGILDRLEKRPADIDIRLYSKEANILDLSKLSHNVLEILLEANDKSKKKMEGSSEEKRNFFATNAFLKFYAPKEHHNVHYSIASLEGKEIAYDLMFVKKMRRPFLFPRDALCLNFTLLWEALKRNHYEPDVLIAKLRSGEEKVEIKPETYKKCGCVMLSVVDQLSKLIRAVDAHEINFTGFWALLSGYAKGFRCLKGASQIEQDLGKTFIDNKNKAEFEYLKNTLKNHHKDNPAAAFVLTYYAIELLKPFGNYSLFWKGIEPFIQDSKHVFLKQIYRAIFPGDELPGVDIKEIEAFLQAKAFLQMCTTENQSDFQSTLLMHDEKPAIQIDLNGAHLLLPFNPIEAFKILNESKHELLQGLVNGFIVPNRGYSDHSLIYQNLKKLNLNWEEFEKIADSLEKSQLGFELKLACAVLKRDEKFFEQIISKKPHFLENDHLIESISHLKNADSILTDYRKKTQNMTKINKWISALARSPYFIYGFERWEEKKNTSSENLLHVEAFASQSPSLALKVMKTLNKEDGIKAFKYIVKSCRSRNQCVLDFSILFDSLKWTLEVCQPKDCKEISKEIHWLIHQSLTQNQIKQAYDLLNLLHEQEVDIIDICPQILDSYKQLRENVTGKLTIEEIFFLLEGMKGILEVFKPKDTEEIFKEIHWLIHQSITQNQIKQAFDFLNFLQKQGFDVKDPYPQVVTAYEKLQKNLTNELAIKEACIEMIQHLCLQKDISFWKKAFSMIKGLCDKHGVEWSKVVFDCLNEESSSAAFAFVFYLTYFVGDAQKLSHLWKETFLPPWQAFANLINQGVPFEEIFSLLQAKAFLQACAENKEEESLGLLGKEHVLQLDLGKGYLFFPCRPVKAFKTINDSTHPKLNEWLEEWMEEMLFPMTSYRYNPRIGESFVAQRWVELEKLASTLKNSRLADELKLVCAIQTRKNSDQGDFIGHLSKYDDRRIVHSISQLKHPEAKSAKNLLENTNKFPGRIKNLIIALIDEFPLQAYEKFLEQENDPDLNLATLQSLSTVKPDLALKIIKRFEIDEATKHWKNICKVYKEKNESFIESELLETFYWLFDDKERSNKLNDVSKKIIWIIKELFNRNEVEKLCQFLTFINDRGFCINDYFQYLTCVISDKKNSSQNKRHAWSFVMKTIENFPIFKVLPRVNEWIELIDEGKQDEYIQKIFLKGKKSLLTSTCPLEERKINIESYKKAFSELPSKILSQVALDEIQLHAVEVLSAQKDLNLWKEACSLLREYFLKNDVSEAAFSILLTLLEKLKEIKGKKPDVEIHDIMRIAKEKGCLKRVDRQLKLLNVLNGQDDCCIFREAIDVIEIVFQEELTLDNKDLWNKIIRIIEKIKSIEGLKNDERFSLLEQLKKIESLSFRKDFEEIKKSAYTAYLTSLLKTDSTSNAALDNAKFDRICHSFKIFHPHLAKEVVTSLFKDLRTQMESHFKLPKSLSSLILSYYELLLLIFEKDKKKSLASLTEILCKCNNLNHLTKCHEIFVKEDCKDYLPVIKDAVDKLSPSAWKDYQDSYAKVFPLLKFSNAFGEPLSEHFCYNLVLLGETFLKNNVSSCYELLNTIALYSKNHRAADKIQALAVKFSNANFNELFDPILHLWGSLKDRGYLEVKSTEYKKLLCNLIKKVCATNDELKFLVRLFEAYKKIDSSSQQNKEISSALQSHIKMLMEDKTSLRPWTILQQCGDGLSREEEFSLRIALIKQICEAEMPSPAAKMLIELFKKFPGKDHENVDRKVILLILEKLYQNESYKDVFEVLLQTPYTQEVLKQDSALLQKYQKWLDALNESSKYQNIFDKLVAVAEKKEKKVKKEDLEENLRNLEENFLAIQDNRQLHSVAKLVGDTIAKLSIDGSKLRIDLIDRTVDKLGKVFAIQSLVKISNEDRGITAENQNNIFVIETKEVSRKLIDFNLILLKKLLDVYYTDAKLKKSVLDNIYDFISKIKAFDNLDLNLFYELLESYCFCPFNKKEVKEHENHLGKIRELFDLDSIKKLEKKDWFNCVACYAKLVGTFCADFQSMAFYGAYSRMIKKLLGFNTKESRQEAMHLIFEWNSNISFSSRAYYDIYDAFIKSINESQESPEEKFEFLKDLQEKLIKTVCDSNICKLYKRPSFVLFQNGDKVNFQLLIILLFTSLLDCPVSPERQVEKFLTAHKFLLSCQSLEGFKGFYIEYMVCVEKYFENLKVYIEKAKIEGKTLFKLLSSHLLLITRNEKFDKVDLDLRKMAVNKLLKYLLEEKNSTFSIFFAKHTLSRVENLLPHDSYLRMKNASETDFKESLQRCSKEEFQNIIMSFQIPSIGLKTVLDTKLNLKEYIEKLDWVFEALYAAIQKDKDENKALLESISNIIVLAVEKGQSEKSVGSVDKYLLKWLQQLLEIDHPCNVYKLIQNIQNEGYVFKVNSEDYQNLLIEILNRSDFEYSPPKTKTEEPPYVTKIIDRLLQISTEYRLPNENLLSKFGGKLLEILKKKVREGKEEEIETHLTGNLKFLLSNEQRVEIRKFIIESHLSKGNLVAGAEYLDDLIQSFSKIDNEKLLNEIDSILVKTLRKFFKDKYNFKNEVWCLEYAYDIFRLKFTSRAIKKYPKLFAHLFERFIKLGACLPNGYQKVEVVKEIVKKHYSSLDQFCVPDICKIEEQLSKLESTKEIDCLALLEVLKNLKSISIDKTISTEKVMGRTLNIFKDCFFGIKKWKGSSRQIAKCCLHGVLILNNRNSILFFLDNFMKLLEQFNNQEIDKMRTVRFLLYYLNEGLDKENLGAFDDLIHQIGEYMVSLPSEQNEQHLETNFAQKQALVACQLVLAHREVLKGKVTYLTKIDYNHIAQEQKRTGFLILSKIINNIHEEGVNEVCKIIPNFYAHGDIEQIEFLKNCRYGKLINEALKIIRFDESSECLNEFETILNDAIINHFPQAKEGIYKALLHLNNVGSKSDQLAGLWENFLEKCEESYCLPQLLKRYIFSLLGLHKDQTISDKVVIAKCQALLIECFGINSDVFKFNYEIFWKKLEHFFILQTKGKQALCNGEFIDINKIRQVGIKAKSESEIARKVNEHKISFLINLLEKIKKKELDKETVRCISVYLYNQIVDLLNCRSPNLITLVRGFLFSPCLYNQILCEQLITFSQSEGIFKNHPEVLFQIKCLYPDIIKSQDNIDEARKLELIDELIGILTKDNNGYLLCEYGRLLLITIPKLLKENPHLMLKKFNEAFLTIQKNEKWKSQILVDIAKEFFRAFKGVPPKTTADVTILLSNTLFNQKFASDKSIKYPTPPACIFVKEALIQNQMIYENYLTYVEIIFNLFKSSGNKDIKINLMAIIFDMLLTTPEKFNAKLQFQRMKFTTELMKEILEMNDPELAILVKSTFEAKLIEIYKRYRKEKKELDELYLSKLPTTVNNKRKPISKTRN